MELQYYERLASLESEVKSIQKQNDRIETKLDAYAANFATKNEVKEMFAVRDKEIMELFGEIEKLQEAPEKQADNKRANLALLFSACTILLSIVFGVLSYMK